MNEPIQFSNELLVQWCQSDEMRALQRLAREYHERTEAFDHAWCRARNDKGFAHPQGLEGALCSRFALDQHRQLGTHAAHLGFDSRAWQDAISSEARHFEADWRNGRYRDDPRFNGAWIPTPSTRTT